MTDMIPIMILVKSKKEVKIMKKSFILLSAAFISLVACNKVAVEEQPIIDNNDYVLTFTSERPQIDVDTRTAWDAETSSIVWSEGDKIRIGYTLDGDWMGASAAGDAKFYSSEEVVIDESNASVGTFSVPVSTTTFVDPKTAGDYVFYSVYPASLLSSTTVASAPTATVTLKSIQNPSADSFEASTDIMVGKTAVMALEGLPTDPIELVWDRVVAHGYFTLKDIKGIVAGETITKVTFTAQDGAALAGEFSVSLEDGSFTAPNATNEVVINGSDLEFVEESEMTNLKIWISVLPETLTSLKVDLLTNKAHYVREITGISKTLKRNARNVLAINMASATRTAVEEVVWVKKDISAITSSDVFVIVGNNGNNFAMTNDNGTSAAPKASSISVTDDKLTSNPVDNIQWTLSGNSTDGYTFYPNGTTATWLYCTSSNNGVRVGTNNAKTFKIDNGYLKHSGTSRYVGIYDSSDWRCYTSIGSNIANQTFAFYVKTISGPTKPVPTITFGELITEVNIGEFVTNAATINPDTLPIAYASSSTSIATVDANGKVTGVAAGTATITASFAGDETYDSASASYEITVIDPNANDGSEEKPYTASEAIAAAEALGSGSQEGVYVKGIVSAAGTINSQYNSVTYYISDDGSASNQFEVYSGKYINGADFTEENNLKLGDYVVVRGTLKYYKGQAEFDYNNEVVSVLRAPTFNPDGGTFVTNLTVSISAEAGATIYYTLDGTRPTVATGTEYESAIIISDTKTIKAIAVKDGVETGVVSKTFTKSDVQSYSVTFDFSSITETVEGGWNGAHTISPITISATSANMNKAGQVRFQKNGTVTFTGATITRIEIINSGAYPGDFSANVGNYSLEGNNGVWTGSATEIVLTNNGNGTRTTSIVVTYN